MKARRSAATGSKEGMAVGVATVSAGVSRSDGVPAIRTLVRGLAVLEALAGAKRRLGPTEIASLVGLDKGTVSRLLSTLVDTGYVLRDSESRTYELSTKVLQLSQGLTRQLDLRATAHPYLVQLCQDVNETIHFGVRDGTHVIYIDKVEPQSQPIRMVTVIGTAMPITTTALGKAMLSRYPRGFVDTFLDSLDFPRQTERSIVHRSHFEKELRVTAERGYSIDDRENIDYVTCVGAPIVSSDGEVLGAISISAPSFRVQDRVDELGSRCRQTADAISEHL